MDIDAAHVAGANEWSPAEIASAVRAALASLGERVRSVRVDVRRRGDCHVCRLQARGERGQFVIVECNARLLGDAIEAAADRLEEALEHRVGVRESQETARGRLLLAAGDGDLPGSALHWTALLGNALRMNVDLYRWAPSALARRSRTAVDAVMRRWCTLAMPRAVLSERVMVGSADPLAAVGRLARSRDVEWIVMPAHDGCGAAAVALARAARCPVLVARAPTASSELLVATVAQQDHYPTLKRAARLALALQSSVLVLHDVSDLPSTASLLAQADALGGPWALLQRQCAALPTGQCLPSIDVLISRSGDRAGSVLEQARREDAEVIIVSVSEVEPCTSSAFAEAVANQALRSVLIVPAEAAGPVLRSEREAASLPKRSRVTQRMRPPQATRQVSGSMVVPARQRAQRGLSPRWPRAAGQKRR